MSLPEITNYLEDDWGDNAITGRTSSKEGYFLHPSDGLIADMEAGDALKGVYRPEWTVKAGTPSASGGALVLDPGDEIKTSTNFHTGRWEITWSNASSPSGGFFGFYLFIQNTNSNWFEYTNDVAVGSLVMRKNEAGTTSDILSVAAITDTNQHTTAAERDSYGNWEAFKDGASQGTFTDTFLPDPRWQQLAAGSTYVTVNIQKVVFS